MQQPKHTNIVNRNENIRTELRL